MFTKTVTYGDVTLTLRRTSVRGALLRDSMAVLAGGDVNKSGFVALITNTASAGGLPFDLPDSVPSQEEFDALFDQFLEIDEDLMNAWYLGVIEVNKPIGEKKIESSPPKP